MKKSGVNPIEFQDSHFHRKSILGLELYCFARLALALLCFIIGLFFRAGSMAQMIFMLLCFLSAAYDVVMKTVEEITVHRNLTMEPLVILASLAAFVVRLEVDGAAVMLLYRVCSFVLDYVVRRSEQSVRHAVDHRSATVRILVDELESQVSRDAVRPGDTVVLRGGEVAALDCLVLEGSGSVDASAVNGSSFVQLLGEGDTILAGTRLVSGEIRAEAMGPADASLFQRAWDESCSERSEKGKCERWVELYRKYFAPVALALGAVVAVLLSLIGKCSVSNAIHRSLCILILVNPAGLLAALSVTAHTGVAGALSRGVLFKGIRSVEEAADPAVILLDKNGVLTTGKYKVDSIQAQKLDSEILLKAAAHAAANADTPLASAVVDAYTDKIDFSLIGNFVEYPDGLSVEIEGIPVLLGKSSFLAERGIEVPGGGSDELVLHMTLAGRYAGSIYLSEMSRTGVAETVDALHALGCKDLVILSEDSAEKTHGLSRLCGIEKYYSNCSSEEKLNRLRELRKRSGKAAALYVGAGECESDCLKEADLGVILGDVDSPCAKDAQLLLLSGNLSALSEAVRSAKLTRTVFLQGAAAVLGVKLLMLLLAVFGVSSQLWFDMLLDSCVGIGAVLNAVRAFPVKKG